MSSQRIRTVNITYLTESADNRVFVAGEFTNPHWQLVELQRLPSKSGSGKEFVYAKSFKLPEGTYQYKFRVGEVNWVCDPEVPKVVDSDGFENNLLVVKIPDSPTMDHPSKSPQSLASVSADKDLPLSQQQSDDSHEIPKPASDLEVADLTLPSLMLDATVSPNASELEPDHENNKESSDKSGSPGSQINLQRETESSTREHKEHEAKEKEQTKSASELKDLVALGKDLSEIKNSEALDKESSELKSSAAPDEESTEVKDSGTVDENSVASRKESDPAVPQSVQPSKASGSTNSVSAAETKTEVDAHQVPSLEDDTDSLESDEEYLQSPLLPHERGLGAPPLLPHERLTPISEEDLVIHRSKSRKATQLVQHNHNTNLSDGLCCRSPTAEELADPTIETFPEGLSGILQRMETIKLEYEEDDCRHLEHSNSGNHRPVRKSVSEKSQNCQNRDRLSTYGGFRQSHSFSQLETIPQESAGVEESDHPRLSLDGQSMSSFRTACSHFPVASAETEDRRASRLSRRLTPIIPSRKSSIDRMTAITASPVATPAAEKKVLELKVESHPVASTEEDVIANDGIKDDTDAKSFVSSHSAVEGQGRRFSRSRYHPRSSSLPSKASSIDTAQLSHSTSKVDRLAWYKRLWKWLKELLASLKLKVKSSKKAKFHNA